MLPHSLKFWQRDPPHNRDTNGPQGQGRDRRMPGVTNSNFNHLDEHSYMYYRKNQNKLLGKVVLYEKKQNKNKNKWWLKSNNTSQTKQNIVKRYKNVINKLPKNFSKQNYKTYNTIRNKLSAEDFRALYKFMVEDDYDLLKKLAAKKRKRQEKPTKKKPTPNTNTKRLQQRQMTRNTRDQYNLYNQWNEAKKRDIKAKQLDNLMTRFDDRKNLKEDSGSIWNSNETLREVSLSLVSSKYKEAFEMFL